MFDSRIVPSAGCAVVLLLVACGKDELTSRREPTALGGAVANDGAGPGTGGQAGAEVGGGAAVTGGSSSTGGAGTTGGGSHADDDLLIDDFEDGDTTAMSGASWYVYDDVLNGGGSSVTDFVSDEGFESSHAFLVEYSFDQGELTYEPFIGFGVALGSGPTDLSGYQGIGYTYRGGAHEVRLETTEVTDYDYFAVQVPASASFRTRVLPFGDFFQGGWGAPVDFVPEHVTGVSFHVRGTTGESDRLLVDDVTVLAEVEVSRVADLQIGPPAPPQDVVLESVAVDTDLQERAMASLDRGYNITNWLEQGPFTGFGQYDGDFVAQLADAGFCSLRLPIDLDLFVEGRTVDGDTVTLQVSDDLFTVLDSFDEWTAGQGIGFTIDYHQYDRSLDFADPATLAEIVELWGTVAEHFAENSREDLFFELLNEPELSVTGRPPSAAEWTELANRIIAAIRVHDTTHTVLFGDVEWYGITPLAQRTPLDDDNVIYVFHFYDPFVFTHQGASWAEMATTHDVPYPYSEDRWSEYSSDFGFTSDSPAWHLSQLRSYSTMGTKSALRNRIAEAKAWAVEHQVPVICNEFGVYDVRSLLEDRARYYTDLSDIFEEFAIPWQIWFMIMDPTTGQVLPEYRTAFGLDEE
ncbi:MAG: cellulase family glycosylhydrolase [Polyangiaceae bacterium]|nr:cellulase family glycosylhydrolase [Polyangiaceae bacterium]